MLARAGFPEPRWQQQILLGLPLGSTTPDALDDSPDGLDAGVLIYLDGLSDRSHGRPETRDRDKRIREELRARGYEVFEIVASHLDDREAMARWFGKLARTLISGDHARQTMADTSWFVESGQAES